MKVRSVVLASVSAALFAACAATSGEVAAASPQADVNTAYRALVAGKSKQAIVAYSRAIESRRLAPDTLANALLNRALAYQKLNQHHDAVDDYTAALRLDALSPKLRAVALYNRGLSHHKIARPALAIEDFTSALFLLPEFPQAYYSRANVLRLSGQYLFALSDYEKALKYNHPLKHLPLYGQALTYQALKRPDKARKTLTQALMLKPDFVPARRLMSAMLKARAPVAGLAGAPAAQNAPAFYQASASAEVATSFMPENTDLIVRKGRSPSPVEPPRQLKVTPVAAPADARDNIKVASISPVADTGSPPQASDGQTAHEDNSEEANRKRYANPRQPGLSGWTIQLSSQRDQDAAWSHWAKLRKRFARLLAGQEARVVKADLGTRGVYYRLRINGMTSKAAAVRLCALLKRRGQRCFVSHAQS